MSFSRFYKAILAITALNFAMMAFYTTPILLSAADGQLPFDLRATGYSAADAVSYVAALSDSGKQLYLTTQTMLDTIFPALLALSLMLTLYRLAPQWPALFLTPVAGALFDYYENAAVREILLSAPPDAALVEMASLLTSLKFGSVVLSSIAILVLWRKGKANA